VAAYDVVMEQVSTLEDWRGVDLSQIRALFDMTVAERAAEMVRVSNLMFEIREHAARTREHGEKVRSSGSLTV
jgi:hypothetical protein